MIRRTISTIGTLILLLGAYPLFWPVPIDPVAWEAPEITGYAGR